jgi:hypothetical protein
VKFSFAIGEDEEMPKPLSNFPSDCGIFEPGVGIYKQFWLDCPFALRKQ